MSTNVCTHEKDCQASSHYSDCKSMAYSITHERFLQLVGLKALAHYYNIKSEELRPAIYTALQITEESDPSSHVSDFIWDDDTTVEETLKRLNIGVLPPDPIAESVHFANDAGNALCGNNEADKVSEDSVHVNCIECFRLKLGSLNANS
jgi:hypothetical protein